MTRTGTAAHWTADLTDHITYKLVNTISDSIVWSAGSTLHGHGATCRQCLRATSQHDRGAWWRGPRVDRHIA